jgi:hypothetical protein
MTAETTQRHLQMLLIVSSFGESRRRAHHSTAALLNFKRQQEEVYQFVRIFLETIFFQRGLSGC